ncbi:MAG: 2-hydroxyacyl-CoA dehydratase subunit D [Candidatus Helarchaeales archaeon]
MKETASLEYLKSQKDAGKKIIGIMAHQMVPEEIIHASGAIPVRISLSGSEEICMKGTEYLTAITCPLARSIIGYFDEGNEFLSLIDAFIGGNYCNGDLCGSEYISQYFKVPLIRLTIPWVVNANSINFYKTSLLNLKKNVEKITGRQISMADLKSSIEIYNEVRKKFQEIKNQVGMGKQFQDLVDLFYLLGPDEFLQRLQNGEIEFESQNDGTPVAFTGSYVGFNDQILGMIEGCGFSIRYNDSESIYFHEKLASSDDDPVENLARFYLTSHYSSRMFDTSERTSRLISKTREIEVNGVILHVLKFCDPYVGTKEGVKKRLKSEEIPVLELERDYAQSTGQMITRLEAFKEMIE